MISEKVKFEKVGEAGFCVADKFVVLVRNRFRNVSSEQVNAVVYAYKTRRWGCRKCGQNAKPPVKKDVALAIMKMFDDFEQHESSLPKVVAPPSEEEKLRGEAADLQRRVNDREGTRKLRDQIVRCNLELYGDNYVLSLIRNRIAVFNPATAKEFLDELQQYPITEAWLHKMLFNYGVTGSVIAAHYDYFKQVVLEKGYSTVDNPEEVLAYVIAWRMIAFQDYIAQMTGNPIFYPNEFAWKKRRLRALQHLGS